MARLRNIKTLQKFASAHASIHNHFNLERHLIPRKTYKQNRSTALAEWGNSRHNAGIAGVFGDWFALD